MKHGKRGKHTSIPEKLRTVIERLEKQKFVERVIMDRFEVCKHKYRIGSLNIRHLESRKLWINGYVNGGIQKLFLIGDNDSIIRFIEDYNQELDK
jgi:hypothetical protein